MVSEEATYDKLYYHFNNFCFLYWEVQSKYQKQTFSVKKLLKVFQKFTGKRPPWRPILLKLQTQITGVFQCISRKISEIFFYRTTANCYFTSELKKEGVNIGHQLSCQSQELLQKRQSSDFQTEKRCKFCFQISAGSFCKASISGVYV